ncbi:MAG TPA: hypothetical protein VGI95_06525 [Caulobacteraceae bacterium]|jgi:hypothetical protein
MSEDLKPGEQIIGHWTLFYIPPGGGSKYNGKLLVTDQRLLYDAKLDASLIGVLGNRTASGSLAIEKSDITNVEVSKKLLSKKAILTLSDGSQHTFDYGALSIDKCVEAIQAR